MVSDQGRPFREIRAVADEETVTVYQAYEPAIAEAALAAGRFVPPFRRGRMTWTRQVRESPVRVQWDPERSLRLEPLPYRSLQVSLGGEAARRYADEWVVRLADVTPLAASVSRAVAAGDLEAASAQLPVEMPYPIPDHIAVRLGMTVSREAAPAPPARSG